jgi:WD40 repeat protein
LVHLLDAANGQELETLQLPIPWNRNHPVNCEGVRFSPDGSRLLVTCNLNRLLACWDMATGERTLNRPFPRPIVSGDSFGESIIQWLPDNSGWLLGNSALVEAKTGTPVWTFPHGTSDLKLLSLNSVLTTESSGVEGETRLVASRLPGGKFREAFDAARRAPSENVPKLQPVDLASLNSISKPDGISEWKYERDAVPLFDTVPDLSLGNIRPAAFQFAAANPSHAGLQDTSESNQDMVPPAGPRRPMRRSRLSIFDAGANKLLGEIESTGWSEMLDLSPDGSLVLTGNSWQLGGPYSRLDVWAPAFGKHAIGWDPVITEPGVMENYVLAASFIDKRHVLTRTGHEFVLWELPSCKAVYRLAGAGKLVAFSPTRKYFIFNCEFRDLLLYEALSGKCVGQLEHPVSRSSLCDAGAFRPDGAELATFGSKAYTTVAVHDLETGKIRLEFAVPSFSIDHVEWITPRYLFLHAYPRIRGSKYLLDLENRALVAEYRDGSVRNVGSLDGKVWKTIPEVERASNALEVRELTFPLPSTGPRLEDHAYLYPGADVAVSVKSSVVDRAEIKHELSKRIEAAGLTVARSSDRTLELELVGDSFEPRKLRDGRTLSFRGFDAKWSCYASNRRVWEETKQVPGVTLDISRTEASANLKAREALRAQIHDTIRNLTIPRYVFPNMSELDLPQGKL